jgi:hypothetical protein
MYIYTYQQNRDNVPIQALFIAFVHTVALFICLYKHQHVMRTTNTHTHTYICLYMHSCYIPVGKEGCSLLEAAADSVE